jgi:long-chain fatty acid transport protein
MQWSKIGFVKYLGLAMIGVAIVPAVQAAGFSNYEQGANAMGQASAFTAAADDASAMFYNVGGLGFFDQREFYVGLNLVSLGDSTFKGADPTPGRGEPGNQADQIACTPHLYWVEPVHDRWTVGLSVTTPFGLATEWEDPVEFDSETGLPIRWSGRYITDKFELTDIDLTPSVGYRINDKLAVGLGIVARFSSLEFEQRIDGNDLDPQVPAGTDVGQTRLNSDTDTGIGFNLGILHRVNDFLSWGFSYRSKITVDYGIDGRLTQILTGVPSIDDPIAAALPFGESVPATTSIEFPDQASLGVGLRFNPSWYFEADFNWTGWSSFDQLTIDLSAPYDGASVSRPQLWDDAINVRTGVRWDRTAKSHWRFGIYWDETPQPEETVSPMLADADRIGYSVGYGLGAEKFVFDIALLYVEYDSRTTASNYDDFLGTYRTNNVTLGMSVGW